LFSPNENKVVIGIYVQFDESKRSNWHQSSDSSKQNAENTDKKKKKKNKLVRLNLFKMYEGQ
jgi:hypothetical protein